MKGFLFLAILIFHGILPLRAQLEDKPELMQICAERSMEGCDFTAVLNDVKDKRMVLLGEFNHGAGEIFTLRNQLIRQLHERLDFDVVLFEAGLGEMIRINDGKDLEAASLTSGFFGIWRNKEFAELMSYLKENEVAVGGFDVQKSGGGFQELINGRLTSEVPQTYREIESEFDRVNGRLRNRNIPYDSVVGETEKLTSDYRRLSQVLRASSCDLTCALVRKGIENRVGYLIYMLEFRKDNDWSKRWYSRDSLMAENVRWLEKNVFPDRKILIVAHNFHVARYSEKETVMGELLEKMNYDMYVLGMFAGSGTYANNSGEPTDMTPPDAERPDIKHVIHDMPGYACFTSLNDPENARKLDMPVVVNDSFIDLYGSDTMILPLHFDGILLLGEVAPPEK